MFDARDDGNGKFDLWWIEILGKRAGKMVSEGSSTHPLQSLDILCGPGLGLQTVLYVYDIFWSKHRGSEKWSPSGLS